MGRIRGNKAVVKALTGCVSAIATCGDCGWQYENQHNALAIAKKHALKYGHSVNVEVVNAVHYVPEGRSTK